MLAIDSDDVDVVDALYLKWGAMGKYIYMYFFSVVRSVEFAIRRDGFGMHKEIDPRVKVAREDFFL